jgi:uncharacterized protein
MSISDALMQTIKQGFALSLDGIHGLAHWSRVCENGLRLADASGADQRVVELFAFLHDSCRLNDGWDREHGRRAAEFVRSLQGTHLALSAERLELLAFACAHHSDGWTQADVTVQTCWDADRLDLGRIGIMPDPGRMCTDAAKEASTIEWAWGRSQSGW